MMKSQHIASSLPAPNAIPLTAAMNGLGNVWIAFHASTRLGSFTTAVTPYFCMFLISAPAENATSSPVITTQRTSTSLRASSRIRASSMTIGLLSALRLALRARRIRITWGDTRSLRTNCASSIFSILPVDHLFDGYRIPHSSPSFCDRRGLAGGQKARTRQVVLSERKVDVSTVLVQDFWKRRPHFHARDNALEHEHVFGAHAIVANRSSPADSREGPDLAPDFIGFGNLALCRKLVHPH